MTIQHKLLQLQYNKMHFDHTNCKNNKIINIKLNMKWSIYHSKNSTFVTQTELQNLSKLTNIKQL